MNTNLCQNILLMSKYIKYSEPEKTTGPSGVVPSM